MGLRDICALYIKTRDNREFCILVHLKRIMSQKKCRADLVPFYSGSRKVLTTNYRYHLFVDEDEIVRVRNIEAVRQLIF